MLHKDVPLFDCGFINTVLRFAHDPKRARTLHGIECRDLDQEYVPFCVKNELGGRRAGCKS